ncbi:glycogen synthase [bacterium]|nr:glycogen synthase [bacterium]
MRIAFATAEMTPFAQVGGLGDVSRWLPATLAAAGDDVRAFLPRYDVMDLAGCDEVPVAGLESLDLGELGTASISELRGAGATVYLVSAPQWFERGGLYAPGADEHLRYAALCRALIAASDALGWMPDVLHANDWHTALLALHADAAGGDWPSIPVVLTIHNLAYQGWFSLDDLPVTGIDPAHPAIDSRESGGINSLRAGIRASDIITTVSPTYSREIVTPQRGEGLDDVLIDKGDALVGILNGIGTEWDPENDPHLPAPYGGDSLDQKSLSTTALRDRFGLTRRGGVPVLGVVSRMAAQKGFGMFRHTLPERLDARRVQLAVIGTGDPSLEAMFSEMATRFPADVGYHRGFDSGLAHLIEAGSDVFLMPSEFEPCGLNQMYSLRYGTVPLVHETGGLADTVVEWDRETGEGTGFLFDDYTAGGFAAALDRAVSAHRDTRSWRRLQRNGMAQDFSWEARAEEYRAVYRRAVAGA